MTIDNVNCELLNSSQQHALEQEQQNCWKSKYIIKKQPFGKQYNSHVSNPPIYQQKNNL